MLDALANCYMSSTLLKRGHYLVNSRCLVIYPDPLEENEAFRHLGDVNDVKAVLGAALGEILRKVAPSRSSEALFATYKRP